MHKGTNILRNCLTWSSLVLVMESMPVFGENVSDTFLRNGNAVKNQQCLLFPMEGLRGLKRDYPPRYINFPRSSRLTPSDDSDMYLRRLRDETKEQNNLPPPKEGSGLYQDTKEIEAKLAGSASRQVKLSTPTPDANKKAHTANEAAPCGITSPAANRSPNASKAAPDDHGAGR